MNLFILFTQTIISFTLNARTMLERGYNQRESFDQLTLIQSQQITFSNNRCHWLNNPRCNKIFYSTY